MRKKSRDDEGLGQLVAHQTTSNQTIDNIGKSLPSEDESNRKRSFLISRTATIETQLPTTNEQQSAKQQQAISGPIKRFISLDNSTTMTNKNIITDIIKDSTIELKKETFTEQALSASTATTSKQSVSKDILTISNLIAAHGDNDNINNKLIKTIAQPSKASLSSLNSNTSSESTILILQTDDLAAKKNAFLISSSSDVLPRKQQKDQKEKEATN